jgi:AraC family transcriptional regulator
VLVVEIPRDRLQAAPKLAETLRSPLQLTRGTLDGLGLTIYSELRTADRFTRLAIEGGILELLANVTRRLRPTAAPVPHPWVEDVLALAAEELAGNVSLTSLARRLGVSPRRLSHGFRTRFGCSLDGYIRALRVRSATEQLTSSDRPLVEIAVSCGFYDQSHFTRIYKEHTGFTPAAHRRSLHAGADTNPALAVQRPVR